MTEQNGTPDVPDDHPRAKSLYYRHKLVDGMHAKVVTPSGLTAHGRGEAFDYLLGEYTNDHTKNTIKAAVAKILLAENPVISVNGNVASLVPKEIVELSNESGAKLEVNIFYQAEGRLEAIEKELRANGADLLLGLGDVEQKQLSNLSSNRRIVDPRGIYSADVVIVPLEDGDRTEALIEANKYVIAIDLNPLSRTAQKANLTIVDNIIRCISLMTEYAKQMKPLLDDDSTGKYKKELQKIVDDFNQKDNLNNVLKEILKTINKAIEEK